MPEKRYEMHLFLPMEIGGEFLNTYLLAIPLSDVEEAMNNQESLVLTTIDESEPDIVISWFSIQNYIAELISLIKDADDDFMVPFLISERGEVLGVNPFEK